MERREWTVGNVLSVVHDLERVSVNFVDAERRISASTVGGGGGGEVRGSINQGSMRCEKRVNYGVRHGSMKFCHTEEVSA